MNLSIEVEKLERSYARSMELLTEIISTLKLNVSNGCITLHSPEAQENFQMWSDRWEARMAQIVS